MFNGDPGGIVLSQDLPPFLLHLSPVFLTGFDFLDGGSQNNKDSIRTGKKKVDGVT